jgi:hypothetical protein
MMALSTCAVCAGFIPVSLAFPHCGAPAVSDVNDDADMDDDEVGVTMVPVYGTPPTANAAEVSPLPWWRRWWR